MHIPRPGLILYLFMRSSRVQKKRAILTIAAIAWGTLSLLLLLAFGEGIKVSTSTGMQGIGKDIAVLWPGTTSLAWQGLPPGRPVRPVIDDIDLLNRRVPNLSGAAGEIQRFGVGIRYDKVETNATIKGVTWGFGELRNNIPAPGGRFLDPMDEQLRRRVAFIGNDLAKKIFGIEDPVGKELFIEKIPYTVTGVMTPKIMMGNYNGMDKDQICIPITTFKAQFGTDKLQMLIIKPDHPARMKFVLGEINRVLGSKYGFDPSDERVFGTWDTVESSESQRNIMAGLQIFLGIIGALTLIIGGVGVANIMYAVVKERTKEIGVKMALGARSSWVTGPVILEGMFYTLFGGAVGLIMATGVIILMGRIPTEGNEALAYLSRPVLSVNIGIVSAVILGLIGLIAGYFPARRASSINPAETLRYE
ncbi:MAG: ABC transporter permease [Deltaproteobacteria bacterium]|nr:ABC transporter permease [Deltaproteobacteria bacterium]